MRGRLALASCAALLSSTFVPQSSLAGEISLRGDFGSAVCALTLGPDRVLGSPFSLTLERGASGAIVLDIRGAGGRKPQIVSGDRRAPFRSESWTSTEALLDFRFPTLSNADEFHITGVAAGGGAVSSAFAASSFRKAVVRFVDDCFGGSTIERAVKIEARMELVRRDRQVANWMLHHLSGGSRPAERAPTSFGRAERRAIAAFARSVGEAPTGYLTPSLYHALFTSSGFAIPPIFDAADSFSGGVAAAKDGELWGMIDKKGWRHAPRFEDIKGTAAGLMPAVEAGRWGVVSGADVPVHEFEYEEVLGCVDGYCPYRRGVRWGFLGADGDLSIPAKFDKVNFFREGRAAVRDRHGWALIDPRGRVLLRLEVERLYSPSENLMIYIDHRGARGYVDLNGRFVVSADYERAKAFKEGLGAVRKGKLWGFVNARGQSVIPFRFRNVSQFDGGLAAAQDSNGLWGYIDTSGAWAIRPKFLRGFQFRDGVAIVRAVNSLLPDSRRPEDLRRGFIDVHGNWIYPPVFEDVYQFKEGLAPVKLLGKWGYLDLEKVLLRR